VESAGRTDPVLVHARTAGWSGIVFAVLLAVVLLLVRHRPRLGDPGTHR
jgi:hypothetical protein